MTSAASAQARVEATGLARRVARTLRDSSTSAMLAGLIFGMLGVLLVMQGNPARTGLCASCFMENIAGALGLHGHARMAYLRPELLGIVLGAFASAALSRELRPQAVNMAAFRFGGGALMILGSAIFLGCPLKLLYRLGGGDLTALAGAAGLVLGVWVATRYLRAGFAPPRSAPQRSLEASVALVLLALLLVGALVVRPVFVVFAERGPGAQHAPWWISLAAGLLFGLLGQRSRFCSTGAVRDALLIRALRPLFPVLGMVAAAALMSLWSGDFRLALQGQASSHLAYGWSLLGMALVGMVAVLIDGCPFRQLVRAAEGDGGAVAAVLGMLLGAALIQAWSLGATVAGPTPRGEVALLLGLAMVLFYAGRRLRWQAARKSR